MLSAAKRRDDAPLLYTAAVATSVYAACAAQPPALPSLHPGAARLQRRSARVRAPRPGDLGPSRYPQHDEPADRGRVRVDRLPVMPARRSHQGYFLQTRSPHSRRGPPPRSMLRSARSTPVTRCVRGHGAASRAEIAAWSRRISSASLSVVWDAHIDTNA
ncbi:hypothetical protein PsYK624_167330 [Phanerochaete sordida]|uniref:Uncharacterized protein n=1 Tax=Phanerochaete sordida TaxID=48140 RepID=A0A9P3GXE6_9APHY|nr:hypothetical protein PsYK624_167330 [Phanerochaete sordida]